MERLTTPLGVIEIRIDDVPVPYTAQECERIKHLCPDVLGRYQIAVRLVPDGSRHSIACVFTPTCQYKTAHESGERMELQSFYNDDRLKLSIGVEFDIGYWPEEYDYDAKYLANGMAYLVHPHTKTERYVFGISWIDDVGWDDPIDGAEREIQTWYGADPTLAL
ncbi:MAG: hypothetical protein IKG18_03330 [Atopobiaceae bacterium]|nr:hypothetical protein [Atopobiaceae bacterium]